MRNCFSLFCLIVGFARHYKYLLDELDEFKCKNPAADSKTQQLSNIYVLYVEFADNVDNPSHL